MEAADSLFRDLTNKLELLSSIKTLQLSRNTVTRNCEVMVKDLTLQKCYCTRRAVNNMKEYKRGVDIFQSFTNLIEKTHLLGLKLVSITMNAASAMVGKVIDCQMHNYHCKYTNRNYALQCLI